MGPRQRRRIRLVDGIHHVYTRGVRKEPIFLTDNDRHYFLGMLERAVRRYGLCLCSYCLMDNHVHFLIRTPHANLSEAMQMLFSSYARRFNQRHSGRGHVLEDRFFSPLVEPGWPLFRTSVYQHRNPVVARMVARAEDYLWSSYRAFLHPSECPDWLHPEEVLAYLGGTDEDRRREYRDLVTGWSDEDPIEALRYYERRLAIGGEEFRRRWGDLDEEFEEHAAELGLEDAQLVSFEAPDPGRVLQTVEEVFGCPGLFLRGRERPPHPARLAAALIFRMLGMKHRDIGVAIGGLAVRTVARYLVSGGERLEEEGECGAEFRVAVARSLRRLGRPVAEADLPVAWRGGGAATTGDR